MNTSVNAQKNTLYFKILPATVMGNALEFFDFTIYGIFAATIGRIFFPLEDPTASLIARSLRTPSELVAFMGDED